MSNRLKSISVLFLFFMMASLLTAKEKEVRYLTGHIKEVNDNLITLTNNLAFRTDQHVTAISMTPAVFVLEEDRPEGFVFIKGRKIDITLMKRSGSQFVVPATKQDYDQLTRGKLQEIKSLSKETASIELENGKKWFLSDKTENGVIENWKEGDLIVVVNPQHSKSLHAINTRTTDQVKISKTHEVTTVK